MKESRSKKFDHFIQPYLFVLKEGEGIHKNYLDYSLLLFQVGKADIIPSPKSYKPSTLAMQLLVR